MSASATPISPARFAAALADLSLPLLHGKAAEIHNSIAHLLESNRELEPERDDPDCDAAIVENEQVIDRMRQRLDILKTEVESRGAIWVWGSLDDLAAGKADTADTPVLNGHTNGNMERSSGGMQHQERSNGETLPSRTDPDQVATAHAVRSGRLTDEELARRTQQQMEELNDEEEEGMHL